MPNAKGTLSQLFKTSEDEAIQQPDTQAVWIERALLEPNPKQPRKRFDEDSLRDLGDNLKAVGQIQPILARPHPTKTGHFQIVAGERRWRASGPGYANLPRLRCIVRNLNDVECLTISLSENANRNDISPIEYAQGLADLKKSVPGGTWDAVLHEVGIQRRHLFRLIGLLELPQEAQNKIDSGRWNEKHGRALLEWKGNAKAQDILTKAINDEGLSGNAALARAKAIRVDVTAPAASPSNHSVPGDTNTQNAPARSASEGSGFASGKSSDFQSGPTSIRSIEVGTTNTTDVVRNNLRPLVSLAAEAARVAQQGIPKNQRREVENELQRIEQFIAQIRGAL